MNLYDVISNSKLYKEAADNVLNQSNEKTGKEQSQDLIHRFLQQQLTPKESRDLKQSCKRFVARQFLEKLKSDGNLPELLTREYRLFLTALQICIDAEEELENVLDTRHEVNFSLEVESHNPTVDATTDDTITKPKIEDVD